MANRVDYETPAWLVERIEQHVGLKVNLDVAAKRMTAKAAAYLGPDHRVPERRDALRFDSWRRLVTDLAPPAAWLNPPYTHGWPIEPWLTRACATAREGMPVLSLLPSSQSTNWWHDHVIGHASEVIPLRGRVRFLLDGIPMERPMHEVIVVVWRPGEPPADPRYGPALTAKPFDPPATPEEPTS